MYVELILYVIISIQSKMFWLFEQALLGYYGLL